VFCDLSKVFTYFKLCFVLYYKITCGLKVIGIFVCLQCHTVLEAKNLIPMDPNGLADPYVKVRLVPESNGKAKLKTKMVRSNLCPAWNESFSL